MDWIKDYWPHFDYLFVGCISPDDVTIENPDIKNSYYRSAHINATKYWANKFIQYLRTNNITIPIHWYINWEVDLSSFADSDGSAIKNAFKDHFLQLTDVLTGISHDNGLNEPEFFWSPYFDNVQLLPEVAEIH